MHWPMCDNSIPFVNLNFCMGAIDYAALKWAPDKDLLNKDLLKSGREDLGLEFAPCALFLLYVNFNY
jgi:hypothetical protein